MPSAVHHALQAVVGDDVYGDDPTVLELQEEAARMVGMEAAIWVRVHVRMHAWLFSLLRSTKGERSIASLLASWVTRKLSAVLLPCGKSLNRSSHWSPSRSPPAPWATSARCWRTAASAAARSSWVTSHTCTSTRRAA